MDITPYLELKIAPRAVFDTLAERSTRPRFMLPTEDGDWRVVTWGGFAKQIREAALFCASAGLKSGERACVFAPNRVEWMSAAMGIQAAGGNPQVNRQVSFLSECAGEVGRASSQMNETSDNFTTAAQQRRLGM